MATSHKLEWIISSIDKKGYNVSRADRVTIRRHVMLKAGNAKRLPGKSSQINRGQYPVFVGMQNDNSRTIAQASQWNQIENDQGPNLHIGQVPAPMPLSGWDRASLINGVSLFDLAGVLENIGYSGRIYRSQGPLVSLLRQRKTSYLKHIPRRYGQCVYLDHAVQALVSKVREMLDPSNTAFQIAALRDYGGALRGIKNAITNGKATIQPDVLCAAELLRLIEILSMSAGSAWSQHLSGIICIVRMKGPAGFKTDFEKDLLASLAGLMICESVTRNEPCFLEQAKWQYLLDASTISESILMIERSSVYMSLLKLMTHLPRLFTRVVSMVCCGNESYGPQVLSLILDVKNFQKELLQRHEEAKKLCSGRVNESQGHENSDLRYELLATTLSTLAMANRLLGALGDPKAATLEKDALSYVDDLLNLEATIVRMKGWASFVIRKKVAIGKSVSCTASVWEPTPGKLIERRHFDDWCKVLGNSHYAGPLLITNTSDNSQTQ